MIELSRVNKQFGRFLALHNISLEIKRGRVTGIIGPNGSGKSTLIKSILGLIKPTSGSITVNGHLLDGSGEYRKNIGYMPQNARYPLELKVQEVLTLVKRMRNANPQCERELIDLFGLEPELSKRIRTLSGGNRQKLSAVICCMYNPELLILDEPTAGLDPLSSTRLKEYIMSTRSKERTILMTTHVMSDLDELADDVILLLEGNVQFAGSIDDLKLHTGKPRLESAVARILEASKA
jgi:Cu-processing system ATP-binding protein